MIALNSIIGTYGGLEYFIKARYHIMEHASATASERNELHLYFRRNHAASLASPLWYNARRYSLIVFP